jgi:murein DD-endopeptidase MepM/ murein hydrolase activator NlpD
MFPLKLHAYGLPIPTPDKSGGFGHRRKHDVHTGIDLYCEEGTEVFAIDDGEVVAIFPFTGKKADSGWWEDTDAIMVKHIYCTVLYGEIIIESKLKVGSKVSEGDLLGKVKRVLKEDKGLPMSMLHIEKYELESIEAVWWFLNGEKPTDLLDPYSLLDWERNCDMFKDDEE